LERAGFIQAGQVGAEAGPGAKRIPQRDSLQSSREGAFFQREAAISRAISCCEQVQIILSETGAEFDKLPVFVRPMARAGFKRKSGQSLQDWTHTTRQLIAELAQVGTSGLTSMQAPFTDRPDLKEQLEKLIRYYREVPDETARFTKDETLLAQIKQVSIERVNTIDALIVLLEGIMRQTE
jgi:hypothetical protein